MGQVKADAECFLTAANRFFFPLMYFYHPDLGVLPPYGVDLPICYFATLKGTQTLPPL